MPKVKWGGEDVATATDIDEAESGFTPYAGDIPASGVYRFRLARAKHITFGTGNQGLKVLLTLDGSWKPEHRKFDGCPCWVNVVNTKSAASFVKAFCDALGITSKEFLTSMVIDDDEVVQTIGRTKIADQNLLVYANVKRGRYQADDPWRLEGQGTTFLPLRDEDAEEVADDEPEEEAPKAKGKKGKKDKAKATAEAEEPPF